MIHCMNQKSLGDLLLLCAVEVCINEVIGAIMSIAMSALAGSAVHMSAKLAELCAPVKTPTSMATLAFVILVISCKMAMLSGGLTMPPLL